MFCPNPECPDLVDGGVRGEYVDGVTVCPRCGERLVDGIPPEREDVIGFDAGVEVETVLVTAEGTETAVVRALLEASGIPFTTSGVADQVFPGLAWIGRGCGVVGEGGVSFIVRTEDADAARELLEARELPADAEFPPSDA